MKIFFERFCNVFIAFGVLSCITTFLGFFNRFWWVFEVLVSFRTQYFLSLAIISPILFFKRRRLMGGLFVFCSLLNLALILPYYLPTTPEVSAGSQKFKAMYINVHTANKRFDLVANYIKFNDPDFLFLSEVNQTWINELSSIENLYPFKKFQPRGDNFGIAFYCKYQPKSCEVIYFLSGGVPSIFGEFDLNGKPLYLLSTHPLPPRSAEYTLERNLQLVAIADHMANITGPKMIIGDLNTTPWSSQFSSLLAKASLFDSAIGRGLQLTWPTGIIYFRIPIDHIFVSSEIVVFDRKVGENVGSDHFPIKIDFALSTATQTNLIR